MARGEKMNYVWLMYEHYNGGSCMHCEVLSINSIVSCQLRKSGLQPGNRFLHNLIQKSIHVHKKNVLRYQKKSIINFSAIKENDKYYTNTNSLAFAVVEVVEKPDCCDGWRVPLLPQTQVSFWFSPKNTVPSLFRKCTCTVETVVLGATQGTSESTERWTLFVVIFTLHLLTIGTI